MDYRQYEPIFGSWHITEEIGSGAEAKPDVPYVIYKELLDRYEDVVRENEQLRLQLSAHEPAEKRKLG